MSRIIRRVASGAMALAVSMLSANAVIPVKTSNYAFAAEETETPAEEIHIWDGTADVSWYDSEESELHISKAEELAGLAELVNNGYKMSEQTIILDNDIYLNDTTDYGEWSKDNKPQNEWTPIGIFSYNGSITGKYYFNGTFKGGNHTIYGLYHYYDNTDKEEQHYSGLFGCISGANIIDTNLCDECIYTSAYIDEKENEKVGINLTTTRKIYSGGICGMSFYSKIEHCKTEGKIYTINTGFRSVRNEGDFYYGDKCTGGIVGYAYNSEISKCFNEGQINSDTVETILYEPLYSGGICGYSFSNTTIDNCKNSGTVTTNYNTTATWEEWGIDGILANSGGICGYADADGTAIGNCYNIGEIISAHSAGGIIGKTGDSKQLSIKNCYSTGMIQGELITGGVIGMNQSASPSFENAFFMSGTATKGIGRGNGETSAKNTNNMKKETFAESLGDAFVYVEGDYPKLAFEVENTASKSSTGDVNNDGAVNLKDVVLLRRYIAGGWGVELDETIADVNKDNTVNLKDVVLLRRYIAGGWGVEL